MQRTECDFDGIWRRHVFVEHGRYHSHDNSKPDCYDHLYGNGYQRGRLYFNRHYLCKRECLAHSQCRHSSNDMQRTECNDNGHGRRHVFVEHGRHYRHYNS